MYCYFSGKLHELETVFLFFAKICMTIELYKHKVNICKFKLPLSGLPKYIYILVFISAN